MRRLQSSQFAFLTVSLSIFLSSAIAAQKGFEREDLIQPFLRGEFTQWLIGPIARMASSSERDGYLALRTNEEATRFIEEFWAKRDPSPDQEGNAVFELYEQRAVEADKKYTESAHTGRRTDRGAIYILHSEPESTEYEEFRNVDEPDVELWRYPKTAELGLDGKKPERIYRFARIGDLTSFYSKRKSRGDATDRMRRTRDSQGRAPSRYP